MARSVVTAAAFAISFALTSMLAPARAWAIPEDHSQEIEWHAKQIDQLVPLTSAASCADACRALASMRRSVEKLCTLEPGGERCKQARAKESAAVERVRAACPECESAMIAPLPTPGTTPSPNTTTLPGAPPPSPPRDQSAPGAQKSEETVVNSESTHKSGGCAGCFVARASDASPVGAIFAAIGLTAGLVQRRRRARRNS